MGEALQQLASTLFATGGGSGSTATSAGVIPTVFSWITSDAVLPFFAIGIGCSLALFGVKVIRSVVWGS